MSTATANGYATPKFDIDEYRDELKNAAAEIIDGGFRLTVCNGKNPGGPMGDGWQLQQLTLVKAKKLIDTTAMPAIGMMHGPSGGVIDFDIDGADELDAFNELFDGEPIVLPQYDSGREGGEHRLAACDPRLEATGKATIKFKAGDGKKEITVRIGCKPQDEGQPSGAHSVVPPSRHVVKSSPKSKKYEWSGKQYQWRTGCDLDSIGLPQLPDAVIEKLLEAASPRKSQSKTHCGKGGAGIHGDALRAMLTTTKNMADTNDGSKRLYVTACRAVGYNLTDPEAIATVRAYEKQRPFPQKWTDEEIITRIRDAEKKVKRGEDLIAVRPLTDLGNGERFCQMHGSNVRYCYDWRKWLVWNGQRWKTDDNGEVMRLAKESAKNIYAEAALIDDTKQQDKIAKWAHTSQTKNRLDAMFELAKSEQPIPIDPAAFDTNPWLLNCANGTINLRNGILREHRRDDFISKMIDLEYPDEPGVEPHLWLEFLDTIMAKDQELVGFLQRLMGCSIPGIVEEHILPIFHGNGANGKSVFIETVMAALGEYAMKAPANLLISSGNDRHPTELADLHGRRFVAVTETGDGQRLDERLVKETTGGDTIRARRLYQDFWQFTPSHLSVLVTNHRPIVRGTDNGIWRRLRLVPFEVTIPEEKQDKKLPQKLQAELPAILKWMVQGCLDWQQNGLQPPKQVLMATEDYKTESDTVGLWLEEWCRIDKSGVCKASVAYRNFVNGCDRNCVRELTQTAFGTRLTAKGFTRERRRDGFYYFGFTMNKVPNANV